MHDELFGLMAARRGHFLLESGHHGDLWLDVDRLFVRPDRVRPYVVQLAKKLAPYAVETVCGPLTGGAFLAQLIADEMGVAFVYADRVVRQSAASLFPIDYPIPAELAEYVRGRRVALVNDVINAGSAVRGAIASLQSAGCQLAVLGAVLALGDAADAIAGEAQVPLEALARCLNRIWTPGECPLCTAGTPLEQVGC